MGTYWDNNGKYQKEYESVKHLVPPEGKADTIHGEVLRCVTNLYYDWYNNGAGNFDVRRDQIAFLLWVTGDCNDANIRGIVLRCMDYCECLIDGDERDYIKPNENSMEELADWGISYAFGQEGKPL